MRSGRPPRPAWPDGWWSRWCPPWAVADRAQLRAEIAVSALVGVALGRSLGWFAELGSEPADEVVELIVTALGGLTGAEGDGTG